MEAGQTTSAAILLGTIFVLNPDAAIGAAFGAAFFMLHQDHHDPLKRMAYGLISLVAGYAIGVGWGGPWAMLVAVFGAASAVVVLSSLLESARNGKPSPLLDFVLSVLRGRK